VLGEVDQERPVPPGRDPAAEQAPVAVQLDREPEAGEHPPDGGVPGEQRGGGAAGREQERVARAHVLLLVREHQPLLVVGPAEQPARHHDPRPQQPHHRRPRGGGDVDAQPLQLGGGPVAAGAAHPGVDGAEQGEQQRAERDPPGGEPAVEALGDAPLHAGDHLVHRAHDRHPRGAERVVERRGDAHPRPRRAGRVGGD
jgi:hypothetical protein